MEGSIPLAREGSSDRVSDSRTSDRALGSAGGRSETRERRGNERKANGTVQEVTVVEPGPSIEEVASAVEKRTEALIMAAVQDVLLTVQQIMNPLQSRLNRCERTVKRVTTLKAWGGALAAATGAEWSPTGGDPKEAGGAGDENTEANTEAKAPKEAKDIDGTLELLEAKVETQVPCIAFCTFALIFAVPLRPKHSAILRSR